MSGDIKAINTWARSTACRARAIAMNTGVSVADATAQIMAEDRKASAKARSTRFIAANKVGGGK